MSHHTECSFRRVLMFEVCFAMDASLDDVAWFFSHVCFDRCFNCHTIEEAVLCYCIHRRLPYGRAQQLLKQIRAFPAPALPADSLPVYTRQIHRRILLMKSDSELLDFFRENKGIFQRWNQTAGERIREFISDIRGKDSDREILEACRRGEEFPPHTLSGCGDLLARMDTCTSYDAIRKCLILLKFYHFWVWLFLHPSEPVSSVFDLFRDETDAILNECGYESLYAGNPYDWLFLWASTTEQPLDTLRMAADVMLDGSYTR